MDSESIIRAIKHLDINAEFIMKENNFETIEWLSFNGNLPTFADIEKAFEEVKLKEEFEVAEAATKKAAAETKLAALGLTSDDLKALGLGGN